MSETLKRGDAITELKRAAWARSKSRAETAEQEARDELSAVKRQLWAVQQERDALRAVMKDMQHEGELTCECECDHSDPMTCCAGLRKANYSDEFCIRCEASAVLGATETPHQEPKEKE